MAIFERPYGRQGYDVKCPDGFTTNGWRKVCKKGYVNFQKEKRFAPEFLEYKGMYVFMEISDYLAIDAHCWDDTPFVGQPFGTYSEKEWGELSEEERKPIQRKPIPRAIRTRC